MSARTRVGGDLAAGDSASAKVSPATDVDVDRGADLVITRTFAAPRALLWRAWTDPEHIRSWWGPREHPAAAPTGAPPIRCEVDLRVGGAFRLDVCGPDGGLYPCRGRFREIVEPERLVFDGEAGEGHPCGAGLPPRAVVTVTFTEVAGGTRLTHHTRFASADGRDAAVHAGYDTGWKTSLDRLAGHLE